jgi:hypothetical protein
MLKKKTWIFEDDEIAESVLNMSPCKLKLDEEKSKHAALAQQNGFGPTFLHKF